MSSDGKSYAVKPSFVDHLFDEVPSMYESIVADPFNAELASGTLDLERFQAYVLQDSLTWSVYIAPTPLFVRIWLWS